MTGVYLKDKCFVCNYITLEVLKLCRITVVYNGLEQSQLLVGRVESVVANLE